jgi:threonine aldolase
MKVIDLRSDTVTQPTEQMRRAMAEAAVGDDVYGEDPSINRLQERAAELMGMEAGLFTASGTMSNLVATLTHCQRGDEIIMGDQAHMFWNEAAGASAMAGAQIRLVPNDQRGMINPRDVEAAIRPRGNIHFPPTTLVCLENTHNRCSGGVLTPEDTKQIADVAHAAGAKVHLDGARIFNAAVALELPASELVKDVDDVCFCISKALSCPVGSVLCGSREVIDEARKWRKVVGGGMRQAGVLATAGLVALDTMIDRLAEDHANARQLARGLANIDGIHLDPDSIQTNIVIFEVDRSVGSASEFISALAREGVKVTYPGKQSVRMVTHRHIDSADVADALSRVASVVKQMRAAQRV